MALDYAKIQADWEKTGEYPDSLSHLFDPNTGFQSQVDRQAARPAAKAVAAPIPVSYNQNPADVAKDYYKPIPSGATFDEIQAIKAYNDGIYDTIYTKYINTYYPQVSPGPTSSGSNTAEGWRVPTGIPEVDGAIPPDDPSWAYQPGTNPAPEDPYTTTPPTGGNTLPGYDGGMGGNTPPPPGGNSPFAKYGEGGGTTLTGGNPNYGGAFMSNQYADLSPELVEKRLAELLGTDSPYMQRAQSLAMEQANQRGMLNSSMAAGAGTAAAIDAGLQIASRDADAINQQRGQIRQQRLDVLGRGQEFEMQKSLAHLNADLENWMAGKDQTRKLQLQSAQNASGLTAQYLSGLPDIMSADLNQKDKDRLIKNYMDSYVEGQARVYMSHGMSYEDAKKSATASLGLLRDLSGTGFTNGDTGQAGSANVPTSFDIDAYGKILQKPASERTDAENEYLQRYAQQWAVFNQSGHGD